MNDCTILGTTFVSELSQLLVTRIIDPAPLLMGYCPTIFPNGAMNLWIVTGTLLCILIGAVSSKVVDDSSRIVLSDDATVMDHVSFDDVENNPSGMDIIDIIEPSGTNDASLDEVEDNPSGANASLEEVEDNPSGADASLDDVELNPSGAVASFDDVELNPSGTNASFFDDAVEEDKPSTVDERTSNARR
jgi:hypothetical protein